jgi:hypothetical protein
MYSPSDALVNCLKKSIKTYIKTAPLCFGVKVTPSSGSALIVVTKFAVKIVH